MTSKRAEWLRNREERYYLKKKKKIKLHLARKSVQGLEGNSPLITQGSKTILLRQASAQQLDGKPFQKRRIIRTVSNRQLCKEAAQGESRFRY